MGCINEYITCIKYYLYTDFDTLTKNFRESFRITKNDKITKSDDDMTIHTIIKQKNREFANWARLLKESVSCFGKNVAKSDELYYHGVSCVCIFEDVVINGPPLSTTQSYSVAQTFSNGQHGMIVYLKPMSMNGDYGTCFGCSPISKYKEEKEILFVNSPIEILGVKFRGCGMGKSKWI